MLACARLGVLHLKILHKPAKYFQVEQNADILGMTLHTQHVLDDPYWRCDYLNISEDFQHKNILLVSILIGFSIC